MEQRVRRGQAGRWERLLHAGFGVAVLAVMPASALAAPMNDLCGNATTVAANSSTNGTTIGATSSMIDVYDGNDVWYSFTAPADGQYAIGCVGTGATPLTDPDVDIYLACGGQRVGANYREGFGIDADPHVYPVLTTGQTILIRVVSSTAELGGSPGDFTLTVSSVVPASSPPANDICGTATPVPSTPFSDSHVFNATSGSVVVPGNDITSDACLLNQWPHGTACGTPITPPRTKKWS